MRKILVIAPNWVGDIIMMQVLLKFLKAKYPCEIMVVASSSVASLIMRMPEVARVFKLDLAHGKLDLMLRIKFGRSLIKYDFNEAYILPNSFKSALIPYLAKIKHRFGFIGEMRYGLLNHWYKLDKLRLPRMIDRFVALANGGAMNTSVENPRLNIDEYSQREVVDRFNLDLSRPIVALCPGAQYGPAKRWPETHFSQLARQLLLDGYQVIILGSKQDSQYTKILEKVVESSWLKNLTGLTSLTDTLDLLALAKVVVTNDSGLMHMACSIDAAVIAIYGSSSPSFTPPLTTHVNIMYNKLDCSPCFARECRFGHYNCLKSISPSDVYQRVLCINSV